MSVKRTQAPTAKWSTSSGYSEKRGCKWSTLSDVVDVIPTVTLRGSDVSIINERSVANAAAVDQLEFIHNNTSSTIFSPLLFFLGLLLFIELDDGEDK
jgi:hypothetical protein